MCYTPIKSVNCPNRKRFLVLVGYLLVCSIMPLTSSFAETNEPLFESSYGSTFNESFNDLWNIFGKNIFFNARRWLNTPMGDQTKYFEISALKYSWNNIRYPPWNIVLKEHLKNQIVNYPQSAEGYMWSWHIYTYQYSNNGKEPTTYGLNWPTGSAKHYDTNSKYILTIYRYLMWTDDFEILFETDLDTAPIQSFDSNYNLIANKPGSASVAPGDESKDRTVLQKIMLAMLYQLEQLNGKSGLLETSEEYQPVDYWDNHIAGYRSANLNVYFYASLQAMAAIQRKLKEFRDKIRNGEIEEPINYKRDDVNEFLNNNTFLSNSNDDFDSLAEKVKQRFNNVFWVFLDSGSEKGRYISSVEKCLPDCSGCSGCQNGERKWDFGMTFLQFEAMYYGLVDKDKASAIYNWLNSDYKNIYKYEFAPVSNTVPIESVTNAPTASSGYWWHDINCKIRIGKLSTFDHNSRPDCLLQDFNASPNASYGNHLENGGAIFYTSFYDIMARFKYLGADNAHTRMTGIIKVYTSDDLLGKYAEKSGWEFGVTGVYPESGLVPTVFLYGYMGIDAQEDGLNIRPNFPSDMTYGKVNEIIYHGNTLGIEVNVAPDNEGGKVKAVNIEVKAVEVKANGNPPNDIDLVVGTRYPNEIFSIINKVTGEVQHYKTDGEGVLRVKKLEPLSRRIEKTEPCSNESCPQEQHATYDGKTLTIPFIDILDSSGKMLTYEASLNFDNVNGQPRFLYKGDIQSVQSPNSTCRNATYSYPDGTVILPCVDYYESGIIPICRYSDKIPVFSATLSQPDLNKLSFTLTGASLKNNVDPTYTYCTN